MDAVMKDNLNDFVEQFSDDEVQQFICLLTTLISNLSNGAYPTAEEVYQDGLSRLRKVEKGEAL